MKTRLLFIIALLCALAGSTRAQELPSPVACQQFFSPTGVPLAGGFLYTYASGTLTPQQTFTDFTGGTPNANPIILNAGGFATSSTGSCGLFLNPNQTYRFVLQNSSGSQQWLVDGITASSNNTLLSQPNTWTALQTFNGGISVPGTATLGTANVTGNFSVVGTTTLTGQETGTAYTFLSNPTSMTQDALLTANYDGLFNYVNSAKELTTLPNSIGHFNMYQMNGTPGAHGAYGLYGAAMFTALGTGLGVGVDFDTYYRGTTNNANLLPGVALSTTTLGAGNWTTGVDGIQAVVVHDGTGIMTVGASFMAPGNSNLGGGSMVYDVGFYGLDQHALGTGLTAAFAAAPQTSPGYGFYSAPGNSDFMGNLTVQSLTSTGGPLTVSNAILAAGNITTPSLTMQHVLITNVTPTISSGFGTGASIAQANGPAAIRVNVGTGGVATSGVLGMPTITGVSGWNCSGGNLTAHALNRADDTVQTASTTNTVTMQNQTKSTGAAVAWTASDVLYLSCFAF